jgi:hypothetical protein
MVDFKAEDLLETILTDHECVSEEIVTYIAGFIVHHLQKTLKCETCIAALLGDKNDFLHSLIRQKSRGGKYVKNPNCVFGLRSMKKNFTCKDMFYTYLTI